MRGGFGLPSALLVAALVAASLAGAGTGGQSALRYVPEPLLESLGAGTLALSPDGRSLYLLSGFDNRTRLTVVSRDPRTGALGRPAGTAACVRPWYVRAKRCRVGPGLNNSTAIAVAPDARDVAVGAYPVPQLALYRRESGGGLQVRSCAGDPVPGYACRPVRGLAGVVGLTFSPDGRNLYIAGRRDVGGLFVLARTPATGVLRQLQGASGCFQRMGRRTPERPPCGVVPTEWYVPTTVRVTPDGGTVLTDSSTIKPEGTGIFVFHRDTSTGALTPLTCYVSDPVPPCEQNPLGVHGAGTMVVASDGRTLIVAHAHGLVVLELDPATGGLTRRRCLTRTVTPGCEHLPAPNAESITLAPDGRRLFVGDEGAIRVYALGAAGVLTPGACVTVRRLAGCSRVPDHARAGRLGAMVPSSDGRWLYSVGDRVLAFRVG